MSGFKSYGEDDFDRVFITDSEIYERFAGNFLWSCGYNISGQLGTNNTTGRSSPGTTSGGGNNWQQVSVGSASAAAAAIKTDGTLWTWGNNTSGKLGDNTTTNRSSPVQTSGAGTTWKQVSVGTNHMAAVKTDGTLWTWGANASGQLGTNDTTSRSSPLTVSGGGTDWKQVSAGSNSASPMTAAIKTDGTLLTWGGGAYGALGSNATTARSSPVTVFGGGTTWKQVSCGFGTTGAVKTDGTLWLCGYNSFGQLGAGNTTDRSSFVSPSGGGTNWKQVSVSYRFSTAIKTDGTLWTWGRNHVGQLGTGTTTDRSSPGQTAGGGTDWKFISADPTIGLNWSAIKTDGSLWTCGYNAQGQLGTNNTTSRSSPGTTVSNNRYWKTISSGSRAILGIGD
jgi:alpha-tubulin suppressor-like RCC1 family protein